MFRYRLIDRFLNWLIDAFKPCDDYSHFSEHISESDLKEQKDLADAGLLEWEEGIQKEEAGYSNKLPRNTYISKELLFQVIDTFQKEKALRDSRMGTIEHIINLHYKDWFGDNIRVSAKLVFDIDRAFRYVQQHLPELRGENWLQRQKMAGEIGDESIFTSGGDLNQIKEISNQMKLKFE